jgi:hypothetical protein
VDESPASQHFLWFTAQNVQALHASDNLFHSPIPPLLTGKLRCVQDEAAGDAVQRIGTPSSQDDGMAERKTNDITEVATPTGVLH